MDVAILNREMYTEGAAARPLRVAPSTLHWWLEGRLPQYRPVIRPEPTGSRSVTWAEFVEAGLLRSHRRVHKVPLRELRDFITFCAMSSRCLIPLRTGVPTLALGGSCSSTSRT